MDNNKKRNLDAVSRIDDDILEKQTKKRIALLSSLKQGWSKKRWLITLGSAAASLALIFSTVFILINLLGKTVPVYTGMTVSGKPGSSTTLQMEEALVPSYADPGHDNGLHKGHYKGDCKEDQTPPADEPFETPIEDTLSVIGAAEERYYAKPGEDIYITVHIDNPDSFEILSFTLNGEKYSSYMFEDGSDMENLILKVNVGAAEGVVDYTIDAIKYVDGESIKDVKMEGDKTVEVGVYTEKQPTSTVKNEQIGFNSISFAVSAEDSMGLVGNSEGKLEAVIYDGEQIVARKDISMTGESTVSFDGLATNKVYQYAVLATYDALDGTGINTYVLYKKSFCTKPVVLFDGITLSTTGVQFNLSWDSEAGAKSLTALALYQGESKVRDLSTTALSVDALRPNTAYVLIADYQNGGKTEQIRMEFTTDPLVYTVNYLLQNLAGDGYEQVATTSTVVEQDTLFAPAVNAYEGFTAPAAVQKTARPDDDSFVINYQYTRNSYLLTLKNSGTSTSQLLKYGAPLEAVSKPDFDFVGWFNANGAKITQMPASALTVFATWAGEANANDLYFNVTETDLKITVTGLKNRDLTELHIPAYLSGMPVVGIGARAFLDQTRLVKVTVPDSVTSIGEAAFSGCAALREITVPFVGDRIKTADELYQYPFGYIFGTDSYIGGTQTTQNYRGNSLTQITTTDYYIPTTLTTVTVTGGNILQGAFYACGTLTTVKLPESCTELGSSVFWDCQALQSCTLPQNLQKIGNGAFLRCYVLEAIALPATLKEIGTSSFSSCRALQTITLPSGLQSIGGSAFSGCLALEALHIPASVTSIGTPLFRECLALAQLTVASESTHFRMANGCLVDIAAKKVIAALQNATIPEDDGVTIIGMGVFQMASWLTELTIPANIEQIEQNAFMSCANLQSLQFAPDGALTTIGGSAFSGCDLLSTVSVPDTVTSIGQSSFHCKGLTSISLPFVGAKHVSATDTNQYPLGYIFSGAPSGDAPEGFVKVSQQYHRNETSVGTRNSLFPAGLKTVSVGGTYLPMGAFYGCSMLESISLTGDVTDIGASAFYNCKEITTISLPTSLKTLANLVFRNCEKLETLTIPAGVTSIGSSILLGCTALEALTIPFVGDRIKSASDTNQYPFGFLFGNYSDEKNVAITQQYVTTGTAVTSVTYRIPASLKSVTVTGGNILLGAFYGCTMLESITLPQGITSIGANAFQNCTALSAITLPVTLTSMGTNAFYGCSNLSTVYYNVPSLTLTNAVSPFRNCGTETEGITVHIGANVTAIPAGLFNGGSASTAAKLKSVVFADNSTCQSIGANAFQYCAALESITLPEGLISIGSNVFNGCAALTSITVPQSVTSIGATAFNGCSRLSTIYYNAKNATIGSNAFASCGNATNGIALNIGAEVTNLNTAAFRALNKLQSITVDAANTAYSTDSNILYNKAKTELVLVPLSISGEITLVDGLTSIDTNAFKNCTGLTGITVPSSVTSIGKGAFQGCTALESISLPFVGLSPDAEDYDAVFGAIFGYDVEEFYDYDILYDQAIAFPFINYCPPELSAKTGWQYTYGDSGKGQAGVGFAYAYFYHIPSSLRSVTITGGTTIPVAAFNGCDFITEINLNDSITSIGAYSFQDCANLTEIDLPSSVSSIGEYAFSGCGITSFEIPAALSSFSINILQDCHALTSLTVDSNNTVYRAVNNALVELATKKLIFILDGASIPTDGTLVTTIGAYLFDGNTTLQTLTIPENITTIEPFAFQNCTALKELHLSDGLTTIHRYAFVGCSTLVRITATANSKLTTVGDYAFQNCSSLASVMMPASANMGNSAFGQCMKLVETYGISLSGTLVHHTDFTEPSRVFVDENGYVFVVDGESCYLTGYVGDQTELTLPAKYNDQAYSIYNNAFYGNADLVKVTLPEGITSIGNSAFSRCTALESITLPQTLTEICQNAFYECTSLSNISIPNSVSVIAQNAFDYAACRKNENGVYYVDTWAIAVEEHYFELEKFTVTIREGTRGICANFLGKDIINDFSHVVIPSTIAYIGDYAFINDHTDSVSLLYRGTAEDWAKVTLGKNAVHSQYYNYENGEYYYVERPLYFYSATRPTTAGNYWYDDADYDGVPEIWG